MGKETLLKGYKLLIKELYSPENYYGRIYAQFRNLPSYKSRARYQEGTSKLFKKSLENRRPVETALVVLETSSRKQLSTKPSLALRSCHPGDFGGHFIDFAERITK